MLTAAQCATVAYMNEYGELFCPECASACPECGRADILHEGESCPISQYELSTWNEGDDNDPDGWPDELTDIEHLPEGCMCEYQRGVSCAGCGAELEEDYMYIYGACQEFSDGEDGEA